MSNPSYWDRERIVGKAYKSKSQKNGLNKYHLLIAYSLTLISIGFLMGLGYSALQNYVNK